MTPRAPRIAQPATATDRRPAARRPPQIEQVQRALQRFRRVRTADAAGAPTRGRGRFTRS
jgi:hypothetical protein